MRSETKREGQVIIEDHSAGPHCKLYSSDYQDGKYKVKVGSQVWEWDNKEKKYQKLRLEIIKALKGLKNDLKG